MVQILGDLCRLGGDKLFWKIIMASSRMNIATEREEGFSASEVMHSGKVAVSRSRAGGTRGWSLNNFEGLWSPLAAFDQLLNSTKAQMTQAKASLAEMEDAYQDTPYYSAGWKGFMRSAMIEFSEQFGPPRHCQSYLAYIELSL